MNSLDIIFKAQVGSHAYGTNVEGSDSDFKGVYIQSPEDVLNNGYREQVEVSKDETYYELKCFLELCCTGNPTMIELLFSPEDMIVRKSSIFNKILEHRDKFLSKACRYSFGGYAIAQIQKAQGLDKKMNWEEERKVRKTPLDFCYIITPLGAVELKDWLHRQRTWNEQKQQFYGVSAISHCRDLYFIYPSDGKFGYHGIVKTTPGLEWQKLEDQEVLSNELRLSSIPKDQVGYGKTMYYNKDGYTKHCADYRQYKEWLEKRNTQRYVDVESHGQRIDGKNLLHCFRLLEMGIEVGLGKGVIVRRPNKDFLISIRRGKLDLSSLLEQAGKKIQELEEAFINSTLPDKVDKGFFMSLMVKIRKEHYEQQK